MWLFLCASLYTAPRLINHPPVPLKADASAFAPSRTGCKTGSGACDKGPLAGLCDRISVDDLLGGLSLPTAHCWKRHTGPMLAASRYIRGPRGMTPIYERLVVLENGKYRVLKSMSDFYAAAEARDFGPPLPPTAQPAPPQNKKNPRPSRPTNSRCTSCSRRRTISSRSPTT